MRGFSRKDYKKRIRVASETIDGHRHEYSLRQLPAAYYWEDERTGECIAVVDVVEEAVQVLLRHRPNARIGWDGKGLARDE